MKILIDNGHGINTPGKCSPDGKLKEWAYTRFLAEGIIESLKAKGYDAERIVHEDIDISLGERCRRVNCFCNKLGKDNVLLVSVHCNAAGNGQWMTARGWSAYTTPGHTKSDILAESLYTAAAKIINGQHFRTDRSDGDSDIEERFYILKNTNCAAVLTENLFQDNKEDVSFLLSDLGKSAIIELHVEGIINYIKKL